MSTFSVTTNIYLRSVYSPNRQLCVKSNRANETKNTLSAADSSALNKAIRALGDFKYSDNDKTKWSKSLKSFVDAYNYTISSSDENKGEQTVTSTSKKIKSLTEKYASALKDLGITTKGTEGYMSLSSTATTTISPEEYDEVFGKNSDYMKQLSKYAKKINRSINVAL